MLLLALCLTLSEGCKAPEEENLGIADVLEQEEEKMPEKEPEKEEDSPKEPSSDPTNKEPDVEQPPQETPDASEEPKEEQLPSEKPDEEPPQEEPPSEPEQKPKPVEKEDSGVAITFLSQNVRHSGTRMGVKGDGTGNDIYNRMRRFKSLVQTHDPDIIFYSEARKGAISFLTEQDRYFMETYTTHYRYENGVQAEPLLWKTARFKAVDQGFFWLSKTPHVPSSYDGGETIVSWAILQEKASGEKLYCASTHFRPGNDADIVVPSMLQYHQVADEMEEGIYTFFGGDFNSHYRKFAYESMMDWEKVVDLRDVALYMYDDGLTELGGMYTGTNVNYDAATEDVHLMPEVKKEGSQIDYVMMKPDPHVAVDYYGFDYTTYDYPADDVKPGHISDHFGLVVKVRIATDADYSQYQEEPYDYGDGPMYFET